MKCKDCNLPGCKYQTSDGERECYYIQTGVKVDKLPVQTCGLMRIKKYKAVDPTQIQLCNNSDGEFIHINDIELYLMKEREGFNSLLRNLNIKDDSSDDWHKRYAEKLKNNIELIDKILEEILYDRN